MVMCLEPLVVLPDRPDHRRRASRGVVVVTKDGCEQINTTPHDERLLR